MVWLPVDANGEFFATFRIDAAQFPLEISLTAIDNFQLMPRSDAIIGAIGASEIREIDVASFFLRESAFLPPDRGALYNWRSPAWAERGIDIELLHEHVWSGLNAVTVEGVLIIVN